MSGALNLGKMVEPMSSRAGLEQPSRKVKVQHKVIVLPCLSIKLSRRSGDDKCLLKDRILRTF